MAAHTDLSCSHAPPHRPQLEAAEAAGGWEGGLEGSLDAFQADTGRRPTYTICFY